jgi:hypothetical protein
LDTKKGYTMRKAYYYIGSNNETGELETAKIEAILSRHFDGFTAYEVVGYWKRHREKTLKVEAVTELPATKLAAIAKELRGELKQEAIGLEIVESNFALVS